MKIFGLAGLAYLLFTTGESYLLTTSPRLQHSRRRNERLRCEISDEQLGMRRSLLNSAVLAGFSFIAGVQPALATGTSMVQNGMPSPKNKKLGGLAFKIQSVGYVMVSNRQLYHTIPIIISVD